MNKKYKDHVHSVRTWYPEDYYMKEFDEIEYNFVNDDYEDGSDTFKRIIGVDGSATKIVRRMEGAEEDFQDQFRPPFITSNEGR